MKYFLSLLIVSFCSMTAFSQLTRTGSFVADSPTYPISGDVTVTENAGVLTVVFESNFATIQGIQLEVFLSKTGSLNTATDVKISTMPLDNGSAMSTPITGMRTFTAPSGISITDFDNVLVQCTSAALLWGNASLAPLPQVPIERFGNFVANSSIYPISGDVSVSQDAGVLTVVFESNFATIQGIRLEVFLSKSNILNTATDQKISLTPLDNGSAMSTPITGMRTFTASAGTNIYDFDNVIVQCTSAGVLWGHANLCESNLDLATVVNTDMNYRAEGYITSSAVISSGLSIGYEASDFVELQDGFEVPLTTDFSTQVGTSYGCTIE